MDQHEKRIVIFLRKNPSLDLEVPDIAFHLKLDESYVQNALNKLYHQGLVTARQNEHGRVYWYALAQSKVSQNEETTVQKQQPIDEDKLDSLADDSSFPVVKVLVVLLLFLLLGGGVYVGGIYYDRHVKALTVEAAKAMVPAKEYQPFREKAIAKIDKLEDQIKVLDAKLDSMKTFVAVLEDEMKKPKAAPAKKVTAVKRKR